MHVDVSTSTSLEVLHIIVGSKLLGLLSRYCALFHQIALVAYENSRDITLTIILDRYYPVFDLLETLWLGQIETDHHTLRLLVERHCEGLEALLARCVPNFQVVG